MSMALKCQDLVVGANPLGTLDSISDRVAAIRPRFGVDAPTVHAQTSDNKLHLA